MKTNAINPSRLLPLAASLFVLALTSVGSSQAAELPVVPKTGPVKSADRNFLSKAAKHADEEANISAVAVSRTSNPSVKELAQSIVSDHQGIASQLSTLASTKGVDLPAKTVGASKWETKGAKDFDRDYVKEMIDHDEDAVDLFAKAAKSEDPQIASFASRQLPILQSHLTKAKELLKALK